MSDGDTKLMAKAKARKVRGKAQDSLGEVEGRGRLRPIVVSAVGAVIVLVATGLLTGLLRPGRGMG